MIARANIDEVSKAVLNLSKLTFYLVFYLHLVGCYLWIVTGWHAGKEFYRVDLGEGKCFYQHKDGDIMYTTAENGIKCDDTEKLCIPCDDDYSKWEQGPTFGDE